MTSRVILQPAYILHTRAYRETSLILELFTKEHGRVSAIARGVRQPRSRLRALLQPFNALLISWQGRGELPTVSGFEANGPLRFLHGSHLACGFYLNELLIRLLQKHDPHVELFSIYHHALVQLQAAELAPAPVLRIFEKKLLEQLGFGLLLAEVMPEGGAIKPENNYLFQPELGFSLCAPTQQTNMTFSGKSLLALADETLLDTLALNDAKRLLRLALAPLLGNHALRSRDLFLK